MVCVQDNKRFTGFVGLSNASRGVGMKPELKLTQTLCSANANVFC